MTGSVRKRAITAIRAIHQAFGAPGDWGYDTPKGDALSALYKLYNELVAEAPLRPAPGEGASLEQRLAACLAKAIDTPLLRLNDVERGRGQLMSLFLGSFNAEISEEAAGLLEEAGR